MRVVFNGAIVDAAAATASLLDRELQWGMGVFETMLASEGRIDGFALHVERLNAGAARLGYDYFEAAQLQEWIRQALAANHLLETKARVRVTTFNKNCCVQASEAVPSSEACSVIISEYLRNECSAIAGIKCASYAENIVALNEGKAQGADDVIFLNTRGEVSESSMANIFVVTGGVLYTPSLASGCLPGVTRALIIERVRAAGMEVAEVSLMLEDLMEADEVFLSNAVIGVRAVINIGEVSLNEHSVTEQVRGIYFQR